MYWKTALTKIKQYAFPRTVALERELSAARAEKESVSAALASTRADSDRARARDAQQISELSQRLGNLEAERRAAQQQVMALQDRLEAEQSRHESSLNSTREALDQLQNRQQELLDLQSGLARTFNEFGKQLLESMPLDVARPKQPVLPLVAMASLLLLAVLLLGAVTVRGFQDSTRVLSEAGQGIRDLQVSIKHHIGKQDQLLQELTEALNRSTVRSLLPSDETTGDAGEATGFGPGTLDRRGPPLLMPDELPLQPAGALRFDPQVKALQTNLMTLGFTIGQPNADGLHGPQTQRALEEFKLLYFPLTDQAEMPDNAQLLAAVDKYASQAREDEQQYHIDSGVLAAIRLGSLRTGVEFSFLMELAAVESTFDPSSRAPGSSAAGLFQFRGSTWLESVKVHGAKYGIGKYAEQVEFVVDTDGQRRPVIHDPRLAQHVLDLRYNPRIAALLAAEFVSKNMRRLSSSLEREPGRTELYLSHFLGTRGAISFLRVLDRDPDEIAGEIFPVAARSNRNIFHAGESKPRTMAEVYEIFSRKFNTTRYAEGNPG